MKRRVLSLLLAAMMVVSITACRGGDTASSVPESSAPVESSEEDTGDAPSEADADAPVDIEPYKIGIITGTVSQGEEEFRAAENMKATYGDMIVTATYPDNFTNETETTIANVLSLASDPEVKVIVFVQAVPGASAAIDKARETREDILFICGVPGEDPGVISSKADIVFQADELSMGRTIVEQAVAMGAETLVHYSFPRHMSYALLAARRDLLRENCEAAGIAFVEATAPDPTGDSGVPGAQQFILEDVPRKVDEYGANTAFFSTNCSMQEPLIRQVLAYGAIFPQQCCPSPYHGYPGALGIEIPDEEQGNVPYIIDQITQKVAAGNNTGRMSTWVIPINMLMVESGVLYGIEYCEGRTNGRVDTDKLLPIMNEVAGAPTTVTTYDEEDGKYDNYFMILCDYIVF